MWIRIRIVRLKFGCVVLEWVCGSLERGRTNWNKGIRYYLIRVVRDWNGVTTIIMKVFEIGIGLCKITIELGGI